MGDLGDDFRAWREHKKQRKESNRLSSLELLTEHGFQYECLSDSHYRIGDYDYWPSTGLFIHRPSNVRGRGVFELLKKLEAPVGKNYPCAFCGKEMPTKSARRTHNKYCDKNVDRAQNQQRSASKKRPWDNFSRSAQIEAFECMASDLPDGAYWAMADEFGLSVEDLI